jgi:hypothetical protein
MYPSSFTTWKEYVLPLIAFNLEIEFCYSYTQQDDGAMVIQH